MEKSKKEEMYANIFKSRSETCKSTPNLCALMLSQEMCNSALLSKTEQKKCNSVITKEYKAIK